MPSTETGGPVVTTVVKIVAKIPRLPRRKPPRRKPPTAAKPPAAPQTPPTTATPPKPPPPKAPPHPPPKPPPPAPPPKLEKPGKNGNRDIGDGDNDGFGDFVGDGRMKDENVASTNEPPAAAGGGGAGSKTSGPETYQATAPVARPPGKAPPPPPVGARQPINSAVQLCPIQASHPCDVDKLVVKATSSLGGKIRVLSTPRVRRHEKVKSVPSPKLRELLGRFDLVLDTLAGQPDDPKARARLEASAMLHGGECGLQKHAVLSAKTLAGGPLAADAKDGAAKKKGKNPKAAKGKKPKTPKRPSGELAVARVSPAKRSGAVGPVAVGAGAMGPASGPAASSLGVVFQGAHAIWPAASPHEVEVRVDTCGSRERGAAAKPNTNLVALLRVFREGALETRIEVPPLGEVVDGSPPQPPRPGRRPPKLPASLGGTEVEVTLTRPGGAEDPELATAAQNLRGATEKALLRAARAIVASLEGLAKRRGKGALQKCDLALVAGEIAFQHRPRLGEQPAHGGRHFPVDFDVDGEVKMDVARVEASLYREVELKAKRARLEVRLEVAIFLRASVARKFALRPNKPAVKVPLKPETRLRIVAKSRVRKDGLHLRKAIAAPKAALTLKGALVVDTHGGPALKGKLQRSSLAIDGRIKGVAFWEREIDKPVVLCKEQDVCAFG